MSIQQPTNAPQSPAPNAIPGSIQAGCPECEHAILFSRQPLSGQVIACAGCGAELEVTSRDPVRLELAPEVEEDWGE